jgi:GxxExxY protein
MTSPGARLKRAAFSARACWSPRTRNVSPLVHKDLKLECGYRLDVLVESKVVVELKAVDSLAPVHEAIVLTYLRPSGHRPGLLINFNVNVLKDGIRRYII